MKHYPEEFHIRMIDWYVPWSSCIFSITITVQKWHFFSTPPCLPLPNLITVFPFQPPPQLLFLHFWFLYYIYIYIYTPILSWILFSYSTITIPTLSLSLQRTNPKQTQQPSPKLTLSLIESVSSATLVALLSASLVFVHPALAFKVYNILWFSLFL